MFPQVWQELALVMVLVSNACLRAATPPGMRPLNITALIIPTNHGAKTGDQSQGFDVGGPEMMRI